MANPTVPDLSTKSRLELTRLAEALHVADSDVMTRAELREAIRRAQSPEPATSPRKRSWLGVARGLVASALEQGLNLPEAAALVRGDSRLGDLPKPPPPIATVTLARIYAAQGHLRRAVKTLAQVLEEEPDHDRARELWERFSKDLQRQTAAEAQGVEAAPQPAGQEPGAAAEAALIRLGQYGELQGASGHGPPAPEPATQALPTAAGTPARHLGADDGRRAQPPAERIGGSGARAENKAAEPSPRAAVVAQALTQQPDLAPPTVPLPDPAGAPSEGAHSAAEPCPPPAADPALSRLELTARQDETMTNASRLAPAAALHSASELTLSAKRVTGQQLGDRPLPAAREAVLLNPEEPGAPAVLCWSWPDEDWPGALEAKLFGFCPAPLGAQRQERSFRLGQPRGVLCLQCLPAGLVLRAVLGTTSEAAGFVPLLVAASLRFRAGNDVPHAEFLPSLEGNPVSLAERGLDSPKSVQTAHW